MNKKKPAMTLIEVIIALGITIMILAIAGSMFTTGSKVYSDSDVKSTLQIEGQAIQEKISNIGMQGAEVNEISEDPQSGYVKIKSYVSSDNKPTYFEIKKNGKNLIINRYSDSNYSNVESNQIISENIDALNINSDNGKSIDFDIKLNKTRGFSRDVSHEIKFSINFRNKGN